MSLSSPGKIKGLPVSTVSIQQRKRGSMGRKPQFSSVVSYQGAFSFAPWPVKS